MEESVVKGENILLDFVIEQVVFVPHSIALMPIGFPAPENMESRFNIERNLVFVSKSVGRGDVADEVVVVQIVDVSRERSVERFYGCVSTAVRVFTGLVVVCTGKLSFDSSSFIGELEVLVNSYVAPVAHHNIRLGFFEKRHGLIVHKMN